MLKRYFSGVASAGLLLVIACSPASAAKPAAPVKIGMVSSLFRDVPPALAFAMMRPFGSVMQSMTGVEGELVFGGDVDEIGAKLARNEIHLGIVHGLEFAWIRHKYPEIKPLMIAVNQDPHLRAHLIVNADADINGLADLEGKTLAMPRGTREHCRVFIDKKCKSAGTSAKAHFEKITKPFCAEDALDDVVDSLTPAVIVDNVALECFQRRKPGRFAKLKIVLESEVFPAGVIVYNPAQLDDATLEKFRSGLLKAKTHALGKQMLTFWKLTGFEPIPEDYDDLLVSIVKAYPPAGAENICAKPKTVEAVPVKNEALKTIEAKPASQLREESPRGEAKDAGAGEFAPAEAKTAGSDDGIAPCEAR